VTLGGIKKPCFLQRINKMTTLINKYMLKDPFDMCELRYVLEFEAGTVAQQSVPPKDVVMSKRENLSVHYRFNAKQRIHKANPWGW
jgi:hypothetical protein